MNSGGSSSKRTKFNHNKIMAEGGADAKMNDLKEEQGGAGEKGRDEGMDLGDDKFEELIDRLKISEDDEGDEEETEIESKQKIPKVVKQRVKALRKNQLDITMAEANFYRKMHDLEAESLANMRHLYEKRRDIICGNCEPTQEEREFKLEDDSDSSGDEDDEEMEKEKQDGENGMKTNEKEPALNPKGIPCFWPAVFQSSDMLASLTEMDDLAVLAHLIDIQIEMTDDPMGFKLHFHFTPNEFFSDSVLTKTYIMRCNPDPKYPFSFEGTEIIKSIGYPINWKEGKDTTMKVIKKQQKHKQTGTIRIVEKTVKTQSFFSFFSPPTGETEDMDDEIQEALRNDFEVGQFFRERVVPRAALYFTGELDDAEDEEFGSDSSEDEEEDEENNEEEDAEVSEQGDFALAV